MSGKMSGKNSAIFVICLLLTSIIVISVNTETEVNISEVNVTYVDIPAPENFKVLKDGDDVVLQWEEVDDVDNYKVYRTDDVYGEFPSNWDFELVDEEGWRHEGVLLTNQSYYYLVRGVKEGVEGKMTAIGFCVARHFIDDAENKLHYISIPAGFPDMNDDGVLTASDIVLHLEGGLGGDNNVYIDQVVKWDYTGGGYTEGYYHGGFGWGGDDFVIEPSNGTGISVQDDCDFIWHINGTDEDFTMHFVDDADLKLHYISLPYTFFDHSGDSHLTASDIVLAIEGHTGDGANVNINRVVKWDYTIRTYSEQFYYRDFPADGWTGGTDFAIAPGDGIGIGVSSGANFTWAPILMDLHPPMVVDISPLNTYVVLIDSNITVTFSNHMNLTSVEDSFDWESIDLELEWADNRTFTAQPLQPLEPGTEHTVTITSNAKDIMGNRLDGTGNGIPGDDFVYEFLVESPPAIGHNPPERWHMDDDILIVANVTDDIHLQSVYLEYSFSGGSSYNISMDNTVNDTYTTTLDAPSTECTLEYNIWATDGSGLVTHSGPHSVQVLNLTIPTVISVSQEYDVMPINGTFDIEFSKPMIQDIIGACSISPEAYFETDWSSSYHLNISLYELQPETEYTFTVNKTMATDIHGIPLNEDITYVFMSQRPPKVNTVTGVEEIDKGFDIILEAEIQTDIEISTVTLQYTSTNNVYHRVPANYSGGDVWITAIPRQNRTGEITYRFKAVDISGLVAYSEDHSIFVTNPCSIYLPEDINAEADTPFDFNIRVTSPAGVIRVVLHYTCPEGRQHSVDLLLQSGDPVDGTWGCRLNSEEGQLTYQLEIIDADGESIILPSAPAYLTINEKPVMLGGYFLYLLLLLVACAAGGGAYLLWKKRTNEEEKEVISDESTPLTPAVTTETESSQQFNNTPCTICFGQIEEPDAHHECIHCGNSYHKTCIYELGECPVCGKDPLAGVKDEET